jgi:putative peptide zinc metalloprotease protein
MRLALNPSLSMHPFDVASSKALVICEVPAEKDSTLRYAIPADLVELLKLFDGQKQTSEVLASYNRLHSKDYTTEKIEDLIANFFLPKTLLVSTDSTPSLPANTAKRPLYLYARVSLLSSRTVYPVARALSWLFKTPILLSWLPLVIGAHLMFYLAIFNGRHFNLNEATGAQVLTVTFLTIAAALIHELGHASALVSGGCKRTEIGLGLYLYFPVFYTDVSEAWRLSKKRRALVDVGGIYFQSIFLIFLMALYLATGWPMLLYSVFLIDVAIARTMSPFLRMDGYWLLSDLFGISSLRRQSLNLLKYYALRLIHPSSRSLEAELNLSRTARLVLCAYTILFVGFSLWLSVVMYRQVVYYLLPNYPKYFLAIWHTLQERPLSMFRVLRALFELLWRSTVLAGLSIFVYRTLRTIWRFLRRRLRFRREVCRPALAERE